MARLRGGRQCSHPLRSKPFVCMISRQWKSRRSYARHASLRPWAIGRFAWTSGAGGEDVNSTQIPYTPAYTGQDLIDHVLDDASSNAFRWHGTFVLNYCELTLEDWGYNRYGGIARCMHKSSLVEDLDPVEKCAGEMVMSRSGFYTCQSSSRTSRVTPSYSHKDTKLQWKDLYPPSQPLGLA